MKFWRQKANDAVREQGKGKAILLPICKFLSESEQWQLQTVSGEGESRGQLWYHQWPSNLIGYKKNKKWK